jgi:hypothetical protein
MNKTCGLDVHKDSLFACVLDEQGKKIFEKPRKSRCCAPYRAFKDSVPCVSSPKLAMTCPLFKKQTLWLDGQACVQETKNRQAKYSRLKLCMGTGISGRFWLKYRGLPPRVASRFSRKSTISSPNG